MNSIKFYDSTKWAMEKRKADRMRIGKVLFFLTLYGSLALFMWKAVGFHMVAIFFGLCGGLIFLMRGLPRLLGDKGRLGCCHCNPHANNQYLDPTYSNWAGNVFHKDSSD